MLVVTQPIAQCLEICEAPEGTPATAKRLLELALVTGRPGQAYEMDAAIPGLRHITSCHALRDFAVH